MRRTAAEPHGSDDVRPLAGMMRTWLLVDSVLVLLSGFQLFVLTSQTDTAFAWTIASPITAAFLGAAYWAALLLVFWSSRQQRWADARLAVFGVFVFTSLTTVATVMHLDKFHLASPEIGARVAAWGWLVVYFVVPLALLALLVVQLRVPGADPARVAPLPDVLRVALVAQAGVLLMIGLVLFIAPEAPVWPWALTPLTGRATAAWLIGVGVIAGQTAWENDGRRVRVALAAYGLLGALELVAVLRYPGSLDWSGIPASVYVVFLVVMVAIGAFSLIRDRTLQRSLG